MIDSDLSDLRIGTVGEQLVRYKLMKWGYEAHMVEQDNHYDIIVLHERPIRVQVKSSRSPDISRTNSYRFNCGRAYNKRKRYSSDIIDVMAFVALDIERIKFTLPHSGLVKRINTARFYDEEPHDNWLDIISQL